MRNRVKTPKRRGVLATIRAAMFLWLSGLLYRMLPGLSSRLFRQWFFATRPYHLSHVQQGMRDKAQLLQIEYGANHIQVMEWGSGPVVLLVHGWNGRALQMNSFVEPLLALGYKVVAFDHKGHGESSSRFSSFLEMVRGTQLVMAHYQHELHGVIAHSIGCNAVLKASEGMPQFLRLVLVAPVDDFLSWLEKVRQRIGIDAKLFAHVISQIEADTGLKLEQQCTLDYTNLSRHPVLLVHDKFDRINKVVASHNLLQKLTDSKLMETEALGHARILANPAVVQRAVEHVSAD